MALALDPDSLERLIPDELDPADEAGVETLELHLARYRFAASHARPGRLLDLACGVGYGTRLVADEQPAITQAMGVDVADAAVGYAQSHYADDRVQYSSGDGMAFEDERGFETIISLETVEHVPDPFGFFAHLVGLLRPGGVLVSSVPVTPSVDLNPHHLTDWTRAGFRELGGRHGLEEIAALEQIQHLSPFELIRGQRFKRQNLRENLIAYYLGHPTAALKRLGATLRWGFSSHYLTVAWQRGD